MDISNGAPPRGAYASTPPNHAHRQRRSSSRSQRPNVISAAPADRVQAGRFAPAPLPTSVSLTSTSSLSSLSADDSHHTDSGTADDDNRSNVHPNHQHDGYEDDAEASQHADRLGDTAHTRIPTRLDEEARDEVGELGGFSYTRMPRHFAPHMDPGSSFADSDIETQSQLDETRSILSDVASIFHPNEYLVAQQHQQINQQMQQAYDNEISERGSVFTNNDVEADAPYHVGAADEALRSRRPSVSLLSIASGRPGGRTNYGAIPSGPAASSRYGSTVSLPIPHYAPSLDRMDADASAITMREALVSHSTQPGSNLGLVLIAFSQVCYSTMNLFVKLLEEREGEAARRRQHSDKPALGALEIVGVECLIIWIGSVVTMCVGRSEHILLGPPGTRLLLLARGMFGFLSTLALYISLQTLSLSDATVITFLAPLATGLLANAVLDEPFTLREKVAGMLSLCGVVLIARPSFLFGTPAGEETSPPYDGDLPEGEPGMGGGGESEVARLVGIAVALGGVFLMAGAWVCLRHIGKRASTYHSIAYFALCSWVCSFAAMAVLGEPVVVPDSAQSVAVLLSVGVFSLLAQVFQTLGLQRETAARAATMSYLQIIFALLWQLTLFGTPLEWLSVVGSVLILANGAWVALSKSKEGGDDAVMAH
ncbi:hypothetical protein ACQY0O_002613 [Thecaphora frezii]